MEKSLIRRSKIWKLTMYTSILFKPFQHEMFTYQITYLQNSTMNENRKKKISTEQNKDWKARVTIFLYSKLYSHYRNILFSYSICTYCHWEYILYRVDVVPTSVECSCCLKPTSSKVVLTLLVVVTTSTPTPRGRNDLGFRRQPYVGKQGRDDFHKMNCEPTLVANVILTTLPM